jgi:hypothetical protein
LQWKRAYEAQQEKAEIAGHQNVCCYGKNRRHGRKSFAQHTVRGHVDGGAVILLNKFTVPPEDVDEFLKVFQATTKVMKQQPGFISAQLHRGIAGSSTFFNYAVFESAEH